jgi:hypothetical protein
MARTRPRGRGTRLCSFCGKYQDQVHHLIAGPSVFICDECIQLCNEILAHAEPDPTAPTSGDAMPQVASPWWRRMVERWWIHLMAGMASDRHRPSLA